jgi:predicted nuclease with TOPRIM domain
MTSELIAELRTDNLLSVRNALEAKERENAELRKEADFNFNQYQDCGVELHKACTERDSLAEQNKVLMDTLYKIKTVASNPESVWRLAKEALATGGK